MYSNHNIIRGALAKSDYEKKMGVLSGEMTYDVLQLTQELLDIVSSSDIGGVFLGFAVPTTIPPTSENVNGFYFSIEPGTYTNFIGRNGSPLVISGAVEVLYCVKEDDNMFWVHEEIQEKFDIESVSIEDINNITRN